MKEKFKDVKFRPDSLERINICNEIVDDYLQQNLRLTLRQLYYQLITKNVMPNTEKSYKHLSSLVSDARLAGLMDWGAIVSIHTRFWATKEDSKYRKVEGTRMRRKWIPASSGRSCNEGSDSGAVTEHCWCEVVLDKIHESERSSPKQKCVIECKT